MLWLVFGLLTAVFYAASPVITRYLVRDREFHALSLEPLISTVSLFINLILVVVVTGFAELPGNVLLYGIASGVFVYGAAASWQVACHYKEASFVSPMLQLDSFVAALLGVLVLGESITAVNAAGIVLIFGGGYLVASNGIRMPKVSRGLALVLMSVLFAAMYKFFGELGTISNPLVFALVAQATRSVIGWTVFVAREWRSGLASIRKTVRTRRAAVGVLVRGVTSSGAHICMFVALSMGLLSKVVPVANTAPLFAVVIGGRLLHEKSIRLRLLASALIVAGVLLVAM